MALLVYRYTRSEAIDHCNIQGIFRSESCSSSYICIDRNYLQIRGMNCLLIPLKLEQEPPALLTRSELCDILKLTLAIT